MRYVGIVPTCILFYGQGHRKTVGNCEIGWDRGEKGMEAYPTRIMSSYASSTCILTNDHPH
jgi:hypothetical protein